MARPLRILYPDAHYHVISRGDNRRAIVRDDRDRERRLEWLERSVIQHGWRLHAFCLMTNHEHLFVQTPAANLPQGMKLLNGAYTQYFNHRHGRCGHLFQGRYKAHLVQDDGYFGELSRYIHLNPVRAKTMAGVADPSDYVWSSFRGYLRASQRLDWVTYDTVLAHFGPGDAAARRRKYAWFVRAGIEDPPSRPWKDAWEGAVIGSEVFFKKVKHGLGILEEQPNTSLTPGWVDRPDLEEVVQACATILESDREAWRPGRRSDGADRSLAAYVCRRVYRYSGVSVAEALGYSNGGGVTRSVARAESIGSLRGAAGRLAAAVEAELG